MDIFCQYIYINYISKDIALLKETVHLLNKV